jgi:hypothetical protein
MGFAMCSVIYIFQILILVYIYFYTDVQTNQQNIKEQKPKIHHLSTLPTRDNFVHCNHNLLSSKTMVAMNPPLGNSKPPNFGKPMDYSHHFHRVCYTGFRPTCAYRVLACGGA